MPVPSLSDRLKGLIPPGWFSRSQAPVQGAIVGGLGDALGWLAGRLAYARAQARIATASGFWLDLIAWDFFAERLMRRSGEADGSFRPRILKELFRPRNTRAAITQVVLDTTGAAPGLLEPWNTGDCGAYDVGTFAFAGERTGTGALSGADVSGSAYDIGAYAMIDPVPAMAAFVGRGAWGGYEPAATIYVTAQRVHAAVPDAASQGAYDGGRLAYGGGSPGVPSFFGYDIAGAGLDVGSFATIEPSPPYGAFTGAGFLGPDAFPQEAADADIRAAVRAVTSAGVTAHTSLVA